MMITCNVGAYEDPQTNELHFDVVQSVFLHPYFFFLVFFTSPENLTDSISIALISHISVLQNDILSSFFFILEIRYNNALVYTYYSSTNIILDEQLAIPYNLTKARFHK